MRNARWNGVSAEARSGTATRSGSHAPAAAALATTAGSSLRRSAAPGRPEHRVHVRHDGHRSIARGEEELIELADGVAGVERDGDAFVGHGDVQDPESTT